MLLEDAQDFAASDTFDLGNSKLVSEGDADLYIHPNEQVEANQTSSEVTLALLLLLLQEQAAVY